MLYKHLFASFGKDSSILGSILVKHPENISIGKNVFIDAGVVLNARDKITIGDRVHLSAGCMLVTSYLTDNSTNKHGKEGIAVENDAWVASGAIICPGVTIKSGGVVGAGAVVTKDVQEQTLVGGVPAKEIAVLNEQFKDNYIR